MAAQTLISPFILIAFSLLFTTRSSEAYGITVYWGQNRDEGSLTAACASGSYKYVTLASVPFLGDGMSPILDLAGHCNSWPSNNCTSLSTEIRSCQSLGIQVLLSLCGNGGEYCEVTSQDDAERVADSLWTNYLGGSTGSGPLGDAILDGVDFDIENPYSDRYWDYLTWALSNYSTPERKVYLSAAPQCSNPDPHMSAAINTGLFDYVWVKFYNDTQCDYSIGGAATVLAAWERWSSSLPGSGQLFMGLPASPDAASSGYIPPDVLQNEVLPSITTSPRYGGLMLWNRFYDLNQGYSSNISAAVCAPSSTPPPPPPPEPSSTPPPPPPQPSTTPPPPSPRPSSAIACSQVIVWTTSLVLPAFNFSFLIKLN